MNYRDRVVDGELRARLASAGAVVIDGAKACGKTATATRAARSSVLLDIDAEARRALAIDPSLVLDGARPRLLDEWQVEPALWNQVRRAVDASGAPGQFILTGSAVPPEDANRHTGAGRFSFIRMRPMSLFESGYSSGDISLARLLEGDPPRSGGAEITVRDIAQRITVGGWPAQQDRSVADAARAARDYLEQVRQMDLSRVDNRRRDPARIGALTASLARNISTDVRTSVLAVDSGGADRPLDPRTVADYLDALARLMIIEDQPAWVPHLRSRAALRKGAKRHFVCPSLAVAALGAGPDRILGDLNLLGQLFESLVVRDLRVLAQPLGGQVLYYRDSYGVEVDAIIQLPDGRWGAFEVKLGEGLIDQGADTLRRFLEGIDAVRSGPPSVLGVICPTRYGYRRDDGVAVVPIGALGP
ncbi:MAG: ATP-binding protein [Actinomycetota bacterium]